MNQRPAMRMVNLALALTITLLAVAVLELSATETTMGQTADGAGRNAWVTPLDRLNGEPDIGATGAGSAVALPSAAATATADGRTKGTLGHEAVGTDSDVDQRGAAALEEIDYPWRDLLPEWTIQFHPAEKGAYGYTLTREQHIDIYVRADQSHELLAHVIAHEIGHAIDVSLNSGDDRRRWQASRGIEDAPWWPDNRASDFATGAGDFAESFAAWQVGPESFRSDLGGAPNAAQIQLLDELSRG
ncbi:MAG: hypothetical protein AAGD35_15695 [Actinomycetota bacterium]